MKVHKKIIRITLFNLIIAGLTSSLSFANNVDTLSISSKHMHFNRVNYGQFSYVSILRKTRFSAAEKATIINFEIESTKHNNLPAMLITQNWEKDTIAHTAKTIIDTEHGTNLLHQYFNKSLKYVTGYDFVEKSVEHWPMQSQEKLKMATEEMSNLDGKFWINIHAELVLLPLLPLRAGRVFAVDVCDPGIMPASKAYYKVMGVERHTEASGKMTDTWVIERKLPGSKTDFQRYWISNKTYEIQKIEAFKNNMFQFWYKLESSRIIYK